MTRFTIALAFTALLASSLPGLSQEGTKTDASPRFAFLSRSVVAEKSVTAKKIYSELETLQKSLNEKLKAKAEEGLKLQQQLQGGSLSEQGKDTLRKQLRDVEFEYKKLQEDSQGEFSKVQAKVHEAFFKEAGPIIEALAKEQKLLVILDAESAQASQLITWADSDWVWAFSTEVAKRLDAGPAKPAAKPAAAKPVPANPAPANPVTKKP